MQRILDDLRGVALLGFEAEGDALARTVHPKTGLRKPPPPIPAPEA